MAETTDAWAQLQEIFTRFGLTGLDAFLKEQIVQGKTATEIYQQVRTTDTWKTRFAAILQRQQLGLPPISETDVVNYEKQITAIGQANGIPINTFTRSYFDNLLVKDLSADEFQARVTNFYVHLNQPDNASTMSEIQRLYPTISSGTLFSYATNPAIGQANLDKELLAAQRAAAAKTTGYGELDRQTAEGLGVSQSDAQRGFAQLAQQKSLFTAGPGEDLDNPNISQADQLDATFRGNAVAAERIRRRKEQAASSFGSGTNFANTKEGSTGVGQAQ